MKPESKISLTDQAYRQIRKDIVNCVLQPGAEFTEIDIAERLSMSKTPIREALMRLQFDGFVRAYPRRGYRIEPIKISDINDIFDMRLVVEVGAMDLAVRRITDLEITVLTDLANAMSDDRYNEDPHQSNAVNIGFHEALAGASHNVRLLKSVAQLLQELERFFYLEAQASAVYPDSYASHRDIVAALRERDAKLARTVITDHIEGTRSVLLSSIMDGQSRGQVLLS